MTFIVWNGNPVFEVVLILTGGTVMKTKTLVFRFLAGLLVVALINIQGISQEKEKLTDIGTICILISSAYSQPVLIENFSFLEDWMINDNFVAGNQEMKFILEPWMLDIERNNEIVEELNMVSDWMLEIGFDVMIDETEGLFDWMIEFEQFVIDELLIQTIDYPKLEQWMYDEFFSLDEWTAGDEVEEWMLKCFSLN
ncbi:hypothetical protein [Natronoflexus pectinivorans]|uniref:Uncharacterized protein n=1 Tax=Natronoflexus pectinivorans TaxID=682526 RepID=A0A4R2G9S5_9BACT|nr:hypothetical protein [Natronoflexus pectinivorans]TCO04442.1 hypothetical protein EV194_11831 [Natronoflexus pectinivorans]